MSSPTASSSTPDTTTLPATRGSTRPAPYGPETPAGDRGRLEVRTRAVEKIVTYAADGVPGTVQHASTMQKLRRQSFPRASVTLRGDKAWIDLDVAAAWPCRAERLADNVRRQVLTEATELCSLHIERLDVTLHVVEPGPDSREGRVQ